MSKDDIIKSWKGSAEAPKNEEAPPPNPVGDAELPDKDLESVSGGFSTESFLTWGCCPNTTSSCPTGSKVCPAEDAGGAGSIT